MITKLNILVRAVTSTTKNKKLPYKEERTALQKNKEPPYKEERTGLKTNHPTKKELLYKKQKGPFNRKQK